MYHSLLVEIGSFPFEDGKGQSFRIQVFESRARVTSFENIESPLEKYDK